jgi:hypothetical protein
MASIVTFAGSHSPRALVDVGDGVALEEFVAFGCGVPVPGRTKMSTMITMTAMRPSPTMSLRRQYTPLGWGPTGFLNVDMLQG